jgi:cytoskeletal protein RodZ
MTPRQVAAEHAKRRRERLSRIRTSVAAVSVCLFILLFSGIYVQMAAGRDPALSVSHTKKAAVTQKASGSTTTASPSTTSSSSGSSSSGSSAGSSSSSTQASPVTTSQS